MISIIICDFYVYSFRKIVFIHLTQQINMSHIHYTWHTIGARKYLLNVDKYYEIPAEHSESFSDMNKYEKIMEKKGITFIWVKRWKSKHLWDSAGRGSLLRRGDLGGVSVPSVGSSLVLISSSFWHWPPWPPSQVFAGWLASLCHA